MKDSCPRYSYKYGNKYNQRRVNTCNTNAPGWMRGGEPKVSDLPVTRTVCFSWSTNCCYWSTSIKVRNCGSYLVYYLNSTSADGTHYLRYCSNSWLSSKQKLNASFHLFQIIAIIIITITLTLIIAVYLKHKFTSSTSWNKKRLDLDLEHTKQLGSHAIN